MGKVTNPEGSNIEERLLDLCNTLDERARELREELDRIPDPSPFIEALGKELDEVEALSELLDEAQDTIWQLRSRLGR